jgi:hypothetical protein
MDWYSGNIDADCSASSAIYKFRLWLRSRSTIKTYSDWEESGIDFSKWIKPMDEIDEELYLHFGEIVSPQYCSYGFIQCGEAFEKKGDTYLYETFYCNDNRYFYLGILPEFNQ